MFAFNSYDIGKLLLIFFGIERFRITPPCRINLNINHLHTIIVPHLYVVVQLCLYAGFSYTLI